MSATSTVRAQGRPLTAALQDLLSTRDRHHDAWVESPARASDPVPPPLPRPSEDDGSGTMPGPTEPRERAGAARVPLWLQRRNRQGNATSEQRSLFGEILDWIFAPILLIWPLSVLLTFLVARSLADIPFDRTLHERTDALAQQVKRASGNADISLPRAAGELLTGEEDDRTYVQVIAPRGRLLIGQTDLPSPRLYDYPEPGRIKIRTATYRGSDVRIGYVYIDDGEADDGSPILVQVAETQERRARLANEIIKGVIFPQFLLLPLAVALMWFGLTRGLAPLKSLQGRIRTRSPEDLSPIDPRGAPAEIAPLIEAFNDLLERLGENVESQKRFIASAAHQMKTPLAGLRTQAEIALREPDPAELRRSLELIAVGSARASHVINQLLALARTENQRLSTHAHQRLNLMTLARDTVTESVPEALRRRIDLGFGASTDDDPWPAGTDTLDGPATPLEPPAVWVSGNPLLLRELLNNLIDNALRYTPAGGAVTVEVRSTDDAVELEVEDTGPGIPESERELVFERFHRVLGTQVDGSGLGLAIVKEIADQHAAHITLHAARGDLDPPGARFVIQFPHAPSPRPPERAAGQR
jgi:two-component system sensor histidine kinase TctE